MESNDTDQPISMNDMCDALSRELPSVREEIILQYNLTCPVIAPKVFVEDQIRRGLTLYVPIILILVGTFGNLFSFVILRSRAMRSQSTYIYLSALAVADTAVLYFGLLPLWLSALGEVHDILGSSTWVCKIISVVSFTCSDFSVWLIVAVTVERYIAVCHPLKATDICNVKKARIAITTLLGLFLAINLHLFWTADRVLVNDKHGYECKAASEDYKLFIEQVWPWIDTTLYSSLPFIVIMILNLMIVRQVAIAQRSRGRLSGSVNTSSSERRSFRESSGRKLTLMLLTVSFAFLVTTLPLNIVLISTNMWNAIKDDEQASKFKLGRTITELVMYLNHSMNFFLYCASGQKFRAQVGRLLKSVCQKTAQTPHYRRSFSDHSSVRSTKYQVNMDFEMEPNCNYNGLNYNELSQELSQMTTKDYV